MGCCNKSMFIRANVIQGNPSPVTVPVFDVLPVVSGNPYLNMQLTVSPGTVSGGGSIVRTYQWRRNGVDISGQTSNTYTMVTADTVDSLPQIDCQVTATNIAGSVVGTSSNSKLCTPIILMSCNKIGGSMAFAGTITRKTSPSSVIVQWGDGSSTSVTTSLSKTYGTTGVKNIRVYSELNNILTFNVTTVSTRLVSFIATEIITSLTSISITNQSTAGIFTTLTVKNLPALTNITLTSCSLPAITSTQIDNLPSLASLMLNNMAALTNLTLPVFPSLNTINASTCTLLSTVSINNNPTITGLIFSRCAISSLSISNLTELSTLTLGNVVAGNTISSLDITTNNKLVNANFENIGLSSFTHGTLPDMVVFNIRSNTLSGSFSLSSPLLVDFRADNNDFTSITLSSAALQIVTVEGNVLTTFSVSGEQDLINIDVSENTIDGDHVSQMLADLIVNGASDGQFIATGQTPAAPLNAQGLLDKVTLEGDGWFIDADA